MKRPLCRVRRQGAFERGYCARVFQLARGASGVLALQPEELDLVLEDFDGQVMLTLVQPLLRQLASTRLVAHGDDLKGRNRITLVVDVKGESPQSKAPNSGGTHTLAVSRLPQSVCTVGLCDNIFDGDSPKYD